MVFSGCYGWRVREDDGEGCWSGLLRVGAGLKERRKGSWRLVLLIGSSLYIYICVCVCVCCVGDCELVDVHRTRKLQIIIQTHTKYL